jgi:RNA polymerase sigma-70 factor (ECF subfamily)
VNTGDRRADRAYRAAVAHVESAWSHREDLLAYARRILGSDLDLAEDVVQEAYLRLHEESVAGRRAGDERPWLFRVTRNLALDERRRARSREAVRAALGAAPAEQREPLERLQISEAARNTLREIDQLPPAERRVLLLDQAGMPPTAIARLMDTTTNAVHQSLFRARRRLRAVRSAAWGLVPIPLARALLRAGDTPVLSRLPSGSGEGLTGATVVAVAAALAGGGALVTMEAPSPHPGHVRADAAAVSPRPAAPSQAAVTAAPALPIVGGTVALERPARGSSAPTHTERRPEDAPHRPAPRTERLRPEDQRTSAPLDPVEDEQAEPMPEHADEPSEDPGTDDRDRAVEEREAPSPDAPDERESETHTG